MTSDNEARNLRDSREDDKENTPKDRKTLVREQKRSRKVRKRKGKKVGDLKGVSGLTGPTWDRRKKPNEVLDPER